MKNNFRPGNASRLFRSLTKALAVTAFCIAAFVTKASAQDTANKSRLNELLQSYYTIKDALVSGNANAASAGATAFVKNINGISYQVISEGNVSALVKDAGAIADAKDVKVQRQYFANFSSNMAEVAKALKLSGQPVYIQYCPMKKASWLSNEKAIKNPYYGSSMLTCGKVTDTIE